MKARIDNPIALSSSRLFFPLHGFRTQRPASLPRGHSHVLAAYVPEFPRIGGDKIVREWLSKGIPNTFGDDSGLNADFINQIISPDIIKSTDISTIMICLALVVAFVYWEGGTLLEEFQDEQTMERLEEEYLRKEAGRELSPEEAAEVQRQWLKDRVLKERRRGLGWLAIVTAFVLWTTGVLKELVGNT